MKQFFFTKKKIVLLACICFVAIVVALGLIGASSSLRAYREMRVAKNLLFSAVNSLEKGDLKASAASFAGAQGRAKKADVDLKSHKVGTGFLKIIPYVGTQVRALDRFIQIAERLSRAGILATKALREVPGLDASSSQGEKSIGAMVDQLAGLGNDLAPVEQELRLAQKESRDISKRWLIGRASAMKNELDQRLDEAIDTLQKSRKLMAIVSGIIGTQGAPPKNYMVLQQDPYELRASGGLISAYSILQCTHDSFGLVPYQRASPLVGLNAGEGIPPLPSLGGWMVSYGIAPTLSFWDAGWWPDFPLTIDIINKIWSKNGKAPVDGYITVDPIAIGYMLEKMGPLEVPEFGATVTAENISSIILHFKEIAQDHGHAFVESLSARFFQKLVGSNPANWFSLGRAMGRALEEKHMLLYFKDPAIQKCFSELDWSGEVKKSDGDYLMAVDCNVGGNEVKGYKANFYIKPKMSVEVTRQKDSTLRHHVTYTLDNTSAPTQDPLRYKSYLRLYVPEGAVVDGPVAVAASGLTDSGSEFGKHVFGKFVDVPVGQAVNVQFDYVTPGYDTIFIEKQNGEFSTNVNFTYVEDGSIKKTEKIVLDNEKTLDLSK